MSQSKTRKLLLLGFTSALLSAPAVACGPFFPNQLLFNSGESLTWAPVADFGHEIERLAVPAPAFKAMQPTQKVSVFDQSAAADIADLRDALAALHTPPADQAQIVERYKIAREPEFTWASDVNAWAGSGRPRPPAPVVKVPAGLPREFELYFQGAFQFHAGNMEQARAQWQQVLDLPADQRGYRSVWAQFMIGRSYLDEDPARATTAFGKVRQDVSHGARDSLGLASASLGWEARAEFDLAHDLPAIKLYLDQYSTGDASAVQSLAIVCHTVFHKRVPQVLQSLAADPVSARVLMAYILAHGGLYDEAPTKAMRKALLKAIEHAGAVEVVGADRLAWAAYQSGDMTDAQRWVGKAPHDAPMALWVRAKLQLRAGKTAAAAELLARAARAFPENEFWADVAGAYEANMRTNLSPRDRINAELGALQLARSQYVDALDHLLNAGWWLDAAYVAERVLTEKELVAYVDLACPEGTHDNLRYLLARRLTRAGHWKQARPYYPDKMRPRLDAYIAGIRDGHNSKLSAGERADGLWNAAKIARDEGMELLGTELTPDDFADGGSFTGSNVPETRGASTDAILPPTADELSRVAQSAPKPFKRFHYRYIAAEHAWAAAELMPDETDALAQCLCEAGSWLKVIDPKGANRFYQALVTRCGTTALGREAAQKKWFPEIKRK